MTKKILLKVSKIIFLSNGFYFVYIVCITMELQCSSWLVKLSLFVASICCEVRHENAELVTSKLKILAYVFCPSRLQSLLELKTPLSSTFRATTSSQCWAWRLFPSWSCWPLWRHTVCQKTLMWVVQTHILSTTHLMTDEVKTNGLHCYVHMQHEKPPSLSLSCFYLHLISL